MQLFSYFTFDCPGQFKKCVYLLPRRASLNCFSFWLRAIVVHMRVSLDRSGQAEAVCATSEQTMHLSGEIESIDKDGVEFALGAIVCKQYGYLCSTRGG